MDRFPGVAWTISYAKTRNHPCILGPQRPPWNLLRPRTKRASYFAGLPNFDSPFTVRSDRQQNRHRRMTAEQFLKNLQDHTGSAATVAAKEGEWISKICIE